MSSDLMVFKTDGLTVKVDFYNVNLKIESTPETISTWEMDIGYISKTFQLPDYFDNFQENMLGMAPMLTSDATLLNRQFLYKFVNADGQAGMDLMESYAFNGGSSIAIGGNVTDYQDL